MPGSTIEYIIYRKDGRVVRCMGYNFVDLRSVYGYVMVYRAFDDGGITHEVINQYEIIRIEKHEISLV